MVNINYAEPFGLVGIRIICLEGRCTGSGSSGLNGVGAIGKKIAPGCGKGSSTLPTVWTDCACSFCILSLPFFFSLILASTRAKDRWLGRFCDCAEVIEENESSMIIMLLMLTRYFIVVGLGFLFNTY